MKKKDCYFWYSNDYRSLFISPLRLSYHLDLFDDKIIKVILAIPNNWQQGQDTISPYIKSVPIEKTAFAPLIGMSFRKFLAMPSVEPEKDIYEYDFLLSSGIRVSNIGDSVLLVNTDMEYINLMLSNILGKQVSINGWEPHRFYHLIEGFIKPTRHVSDDSMSYVAGLFIQRYWDSPPPRVTALIIPSPRYEIVRHEVLQNISGKILISYFRYPILKKIFF